MSTTNANVIAQSGNQSNSVIVNSERFYYLGADWIGVFLCVKKIWRLCAGFDYIIISCIIYLIKPMSRKILTISNLQSLATNSEDCFFGWGESAFKSV